MEHLVLGEFIKKIIELTSVDLSRYNRLFLNSLIFYNMKFNENNFKCSRFFKCLGANCLQTKHVILPLKILGIKSLTLKKVNASHIVGRQVVLNIRY